METKALVNALSKVKFCTSSNPVLPIFSFVHMKNGFIETCNGTQGVRLSYDIPFEGSVNLELLLNTLNIYNVVDSISKVDDKLIISAKNATSTLQVFEDSISLFDDVGEPKLEVAVDANFINGLVKCLTTVDRNNLVESQSGITLKVCPTNLSMFSISGFKGTRLSKYSYDVGYDSDGPVLTEIIFPELFCRYIANLYKEPTTLVIADATATIQLGDITFITRIEDITPIDFDSIITKNTVGGYSVIDVPAELINAVDRAVIALSPLKDNKVIDMVLDNKVLSITAKSHLASYEDSIPLDIDNSFKYTVDAIPFQATLKEIKKIGFHNDLILGENDNYFILMETN